MDFSDAAPRHPRPLLRSAQARPALTAARLTTSFVAGLFAWALVRCAAATIARRPGGLAVVGRLGASLAERAGLAAAVWTASRARRRVPAYRAATRGARPWPAAVEAGSLRAYLAALPVLDKRTYVDAYPLAQRCVDGRVPLHGAEIDESSGSSGRPYQWVRSRSELDRIERGLAVQAAHFLQSRSHERIVVLNCFSMGAWATGASVTGALRRLGVIKSCGPDVDKALAAIDLIGPDACYVVCAYPPFLAALLDAATARGSDLSQLELYGFVGGEAMSEPLRDRLQRTFACIASAYGASDLDIGVASETGFAVAVRRAAAADPAFAQDLFGRTGRLPMVFQYDPSTYFVESVEGGDGAELVVTVTRPLLSPRVRYAVHDAGGSIAFHDVLAIAAERGIALPVDGAMRLPLLYVAGRADSTLSHMGANLYPEDIDAALATLAEDHPELGLGAFCLALADAADGSTVPVIHVESASADDATRDLVRRAVGDWLVAHNRDWAAAAQEDARALDFVIEPAAPGTGVFAENAHRIKRRYVVTSDPNGAAA